MWEQGHDVSKPEILAEVLARHFSADDVKRILEAANTQEWKQKLNDNTQRALEKGAFGAPWFWVRNGKGEEEPFFGSDRFVCFSFFCLWGRVDEGLGCDGVRSWIDANEGVGSILCGSSWDCRGMILS